MTRLVWNKFKILVLLSAIISFLVLKKYFSTYVLEASINRYTMVNDYEAKSDKNDQKHVLFWMKFFGQDLNINENVDYLKTINCPVTNCIFTENKNLLKHHEFDAIVFHGAESWKLMNLPVTRSSHQVYVMALQEYKINCKQSPRIITSIL